MAFSPFFVFLVTMALSMVPLIESKGAIPVAMSSALWGDAALTAVGAWLATTLGGVIVSFVAVIIFLPFRKLLEKISFFRKIFAHCDKAVIEWLAKQQEKKRIRTLNRETKRNKTKAPIRQSQQHTPQIVFAPKQQEAPAKTTRAKTRHKKEKPRGDKFSWGRFWIAFVFCALPIPLSGVWTAGALCSVLQLDFWRSILALTVANTIDCSLVAVFCFWLEDYIDLMLSIIMVIVVLVIVYQILKYFVSKAQKRATNGGQFIQND